jgi:hypothetical protein
MELPPSQWFRIVMSVPIKFAVLILSKFYRIDLNRLEC